MMAWWREVIMECEEWLDRDWHNKHDGFDGFDGYDGYAVF